MKQNLEAGLRAAFHSALKACLPNLLDLGSSVISGKFNLECVNSLGFIDDICPDCTTNKEWNTLCPTCERLVPRPHKASGKKTAFQLKSWKRCHDVMGLEHS